MTTQENNQPAILAVLDDLKQVLGDFTPKALAVFFAGSLDLFAKNARKFKN